MTEAHRMGFVEENKLRTRVVRYPKIKKEPVKAYDRDEAAVFMEGLADEPPRTRALLTLISSVGFAKVLSQSVVSIAASSSF